MKKKKHKNIKYKCVAILTVIATLCSAQIIKDSKLYALSLNLGSIDWVGRQMENLFVPQLAMLKNKTTNKSIEDSWLTKQVLNISPILSYCKERSEVLADSTDETTEAWILQAQAFDENYIDENGELVGTELIIEETVDEEPDTQGQEVASLDTSRFGDMDYLLGKYYVVDKTVAIDENVFNAEEWIEEDLSLKKEVEGPQILIYHTHSQESFVDSVEGDLNTSIVGVGDHLTEILEETYGVDVLHHREVYDLIDGELDRSRAYELSCEGVEKVLAENPSIEMVIDDCVIIGLI